MENRIRLIETNEGWSVSCLDLPGCHPQGASRSEALTAITEAITDWLAVEAEVSGIRSAETLEIAVQCQRSPALARKMPSGFFRSSGSKFLVNPVTL